MQNKFSAFRSLLGAYRLSLFVLFLAFYSLFFALFRPLLRRFPYRGEALLYKFVARFVFHVRLSVHGSPSDRRPTLFVSNHTSYLDVAVLGSLVPAYFIAKDDVAHWPVFGPLTRLYGTFFVERKSSRAALQRDTIRPVLEKDINLLVFPEGTSSDGKRVLPFKSSLFSLAEEPLPDGRFVAVQPITILCHAPDPAAEKVLPFYAWYGDGDGDFLSHLWKAFKAGSFAVDVVFHPVLDVPSCGNRKDLAAASEKAISTEVNLLLSCDYAAQFH